MSDTNNTVNQALLNKASKDKFLLVFNPPAAFKRYLTAQGISRDYINPDSVQFSVFGSVVPDVEVPNLTLPYAGQSLKVSAHSRVAPENITIDFTIDNRFKNYWTIWKWLDLMNDAAESKYDARDLGTTNLDYMRNYQVDVSLLGLDEYNKPMMEFIYKKAFPVSLGGIQYNHQDEEEAVCNFTFAFSQLIVKPIFTSL